MTLAAVAPIVVAIALTLWNTPLPVSEAVALLEDVARNPRLKFLVPDTVYYRPLFHVVLSTIWSADTALDLRLSAIRLLQIVPAVGLAGLFLFRLHPRSALDAGAATAATAVLIASPGFRDNLEIPLSYTIVGMPLALAVWCVLERPRQWWTTSALMLLCVLAVGFKEQGLVAFALIMAGWVTAAPGSTRVQPALAVLLAVGYVAVRLTWHPHMAGFEQAIGIGFTEIGTQEATARFGGFPYAVYAYTSAATIANVLFSEPTNGVFRLVLAVIRRTAEPWQYVQLVSSLSLTGLVAWWGARTLSHARKAGWTEESRVSVALLFALAGCGVLSFNYSRDRLGGMAVPFYALAAFHAFRAAAQQASTLRPAAFRAAAAALVLVAGLWHTRAIGTVEGLRVTSARNQMEWLATLPQRTREFADRPAYLSILDTLRDQGTAESAPLPTSYPLPLVGVFTPSDTLGR